MYLVNGNSFAYFIADKVNVRCVPAISYRMHALLRPDRHYRLQLSILIGHPLVIVLRFLKYAAILIICALVSVIAYESYAVWDAERRTQAVLETWLAKPRPVALEALSSEQKDILLAIEDPGFYQHKGVDFTSPGQGMTTITQALVKLLYFDPFEPGFAKIEQSLIARFVLDRHLTKNQQLTLFVNNAYLGEAGGRQVYGFADGAQTYFNKAFAELNRQEFIGLVAMLIGPNAIRPDKPGPYNKRLRRVIAVLEGACRPAGVLDATYAQCGSSG